MQRRQAKFFIDFGKDPTALTGDRYHCFVDETTDDKSGLCGAGLLVTTTDVPEMVIQQALNELENDPDRTMPDRASKDNATLQRLFFHASADSANAHSHLCSSIKKNVEGVFICWLFDAQKVRQERRWAQLNDTDFQNSAWVLGADFITSATTPVCFLVEERNRLGPTGEQWLEAIYRRRDWERYNLKGQAIPIAYPPMSCEIGLKKAPGLQVVDFL